jgi:Tol biopolymer transport system component
MMAATFIRLHDWSKDGKWIAIERSSSSANPPLEFVIINVTDGKSRVMKTIARRGQLSRMVFSPDSRYLAYDRPADEKAAQHDVSVLSVETGAERTAAIGPADESVAGWSPDGRYLLFTSEQGGSVNLRGQPMSSGSPDGPARTLGPASKEPAGMTAAGAL